MFFSKIRGASNPWEIKCHFHFIFYKNLLVETFRSDEKCFGQTERIRLSVRLTDRTLNNLAQTGYNDFIIVSQLVFQNVCCRKLQEEFLLSPGKNALKWIKSKEFAVTFKTWL